jgi:FlaA1/EpsC-like NDP-sugar epimerase
MLPSLARITAIAGAVISLWLMLRVGSRQQSIMLIVMFTVWVAMPFGVMLLMGRRSRQWQWSEDVRFKLAVLSIAITDITVIIYAYIAFGPSSPQPAFWFMVVPFVSIIALGAFWLWESMKHKVK